MKRGVHLRFSSKVPSDSLESIKDLIFLHPHQQRDESGILLAIQEYGQPRIHKVADKLRIHIGDHVPQSLFAYDDAEQTGHPVGVIIFSRPDYETINIIHIAVDPDYAMHGKYAETGLGMNLVEQVRIIAAKVSGIKKIKFYYRRNLELKV